jgi:hypothetical protein
LPLRAKVLKVLGVANSARRTSALALVVLAISVSCSSNDRYSAPKVFTVSNDAVTQVVRDAVAGDRFAAQLDGAPEVGCTGRTTCMVSYTVHEANGTVFHKERIADEQLILPTAQVWKALFNDPQFQSGTITVKGPVPNVRGGSDVQTYFALTCYRAAAAKIGWDDTDGHGVRKQCIYRPQTKGLPEYP